MKTKTATTNAYENAYNNVLPEALALDAKTLEVFNLDVEFAVGLVLGKAETLRPLRAKMAQLPDFDVACCDELERNALALAYAQGRCIAMSKPLDLSATRADAVTLRRQLEIDAHSLVSRGLLEPSLLANLSNGTSDRDLAGDLLALYAAFRAEPAKHEGKTPVTAEELARACGLADTLLHAVAQREEPRSETTVALALVRQRIFTLFVRGYDQVRRGVSFLRWNEGDADDFAPSLYVSHGRPARAPAPAEQATPATPAAPTAPAAPSALEALVAMAPQHPVPQNDPFKR